MATTTETDAIIRWVIEKYPQFRPHPVLKGSIHNNAEDTSDYATHIFIKQSIIHISIPIVVRKTSPFPRDRHTSSIPIGDPNLFQKIQEILENL